MLSSQTACCTMKLNRITKIRRISFVADFDIFVIVIRVKLLIEVERLYSYLVIFVSHLSRYFLENWELFTATIPGILFRSLLSQKIFHFDGSINPLFHPCTCMGLKLDSHNVTSKKPCETFNIMVFKHISMNFFLTDDI